MRDDRTTAEKLAFTLEFLVKEGHVPGLLPKNVTAAAEMLRDQERELIELRAALATKNHIVEATATSKNYRTDIRATFVIADPRIYYSEMSVDDMRAYGQAPHDWELHIARQLVRVGTAEWMRDLKEKAFVAVRKAIAMETRRAETTGSVAKR